MTADIDAPLKLVIPGNHDFSLDTDIFRQRIAEAKRISEGRINDELVRKEYGSEGDAKRLFVWWCRTLTKGYEGFTHVYIPGNIPELCYSAWPRGQVMFRDSRDK